MHTQLSEDQVCQRVRRYVEENFLYMRPNFELGDEDRLLERGVIDSMGVAELVAFIDEEFGIQISDDEISEANLGSLSSIGRFVCVKRASIAA
jgi:acyl carrier protein